MNQLKKFLDRYGWKGFISLLFYPITTLVTTPVRLCQTFLNCSVLAEGKNWGNYPHFSLHSSINSLFYWTRALNLYRFGRTGTSPYFNLRESSLTHCFHYSFPSLYAYWKAGAVTLLFGMFGWWAGHFLWFDVYGQNQIWIFTVLWLALTSTTFYLNTFALQNYNVLGWLFVPAGLCGWLTGQWALAAVAWLGASFGSFTVVVLIGILSIVYSFQVSSLFPIITVVPAGIKIITHLWPILKGKEYIHTFKSIAKAIGITGRNVKYKRTSMMRFDVRWIYFLLLYSQFIAVVSLHQRNFPLMLMLGVVIWVINSKLVRFADDQSMYMLIFCLGTAVIIKSSAHNIWLIASYWLLISPLPRFAGSPSQSSLSIVPVFRPFNIDSLLKGLEKFLSPVSEGQRVLMAFENPKNRYDAIFDGYRVLLELPLYVAAEKMIHFMPDFWSVFELNYEGAPDFWGRGVEDVERQMRFWKADYVVIYQESGTKLEEKWILNGFKVISQFSWAQFEAIFNDVKPYSGFTPDWWLLKK
ncbi:MAG: hypothetical protein ACFFDI_12390 [Promethearchaeota archaeon]